jgi:hypothetical protein
VQLSLVPWGPTEHEERALIALSHRGELFADGRRIADDCVSFAIHNAYLLCTTQK